MGFQVKRGDAVFEAPDLATLKDWAKNKRIEADDLIYHPDLGKWQYGKDTVELNGLIGGKAGELARLNKLSWLLFLLSILLMFISPQLGGFLFFIAVAVAVFYPLKK